MTDKSFRFMVKFQVQGIQLQDNTRLEEWILNLFHSTLVNKNIDIYGLQKLEDKKDKSVALFYIWVNNFNKSSPEFIRTQTLKYFDNLLKNNPFYPLEDTKAYPVHGEITEQVSLRWLGARERKVDIISKVYERYQLEIQLDRVYKSNGSNEPIADGSRNTQQIFEWYKANKAIDTYQGYEVRIVDYIANQGIIVDVLRPEIHSPEQVMERVKDALLYWAERSDQGFCKVDGQNCSVKGELKRIQCACKQRTFYNYNEAKAVMNEITNNQADTYLYKLSSNKSPEDGKGYLKTNKYFVSIHTNRFSLGSRENALKEKSHDIKVLTKFNDEDLYKWVKSHNLASENVKVLEYIPNTGILVSVSSSSKNNFSRDKEIIQSHFTHNGIHLFNGKIHNSSFIYNDVIFGVLSKIYRVVGGSQRYVYSRAEILDRIGHYYTTQNTEFSMNGVSDILNQVEQKVLLCGKSEKNRSFSYDELFNLSRESLEQIGGYFELRTHYLDDFELIRLIIEKSRYPNNEIFLPNYIDSTKIELQNIALELGLKNGAKMTKAQLVKLIGNTLQRENCDLNVYNAHRITFDDLDKMSVHELRDFAVQNGLVYKTTHNKDDLIESLLYQLERVKNTRTNLRESPRRMSSNDEKDDESSDESDSELDLSEMTIPELKQFAKEHDICIPSGKRKKEIVSFLKRKLKN